MKLIPLNARVSHDAEYSPDMDVALMAIRHAELSEPIRLSTDPTERISVDPPAYASRSTWSNGGGILPVFFDFILLSAVVPGDEEGVPLAAQIVVENVAADIGPKLRGRTGRATLDLAVFKLGDLSSPVMQVMELEQVEISGDAGQITLSFSREPWTSEPYPAGRFTRDRFPALFP